MTRTSHIICTIGIYVLAAFLVAGFLLIVASITVIPMWANYRDHGSIFIQLAPSSPKGTT